MKSASDRLPEDPEQLREIILGLRSAVVEKDELLAQKDGHIDTWKSKYQQILEQFRLAQQRQFGKSGESAEQLGLFNEGEEIAVATATDADADAQTVPTEPSQPPNVETALPDKYFDQLGLGQLLFEQDKLELAELFLLKAQQLFPEYAGNDSSYWFLATLYLRQENYAQAEAQLEQLIAINAEHYPALLELAKLRAKRGDNAGAAAALESAIYIYPYEIELHQELAGYQAELGNWGEVARARRALLALDPVDKAEAFYQLARAYERDGNRSSAHEQILYALEIAPNFQRAQELLLVLRASTPAATELQ